MKSLNISTESHHRLRLAPAYHYCHHHHHFGKGTKLHMIEKFGIHKIEYWDEPNSHYDLHFIDEESMVKFTMEHL